MNFSSLARQNAFRVFLLGLIFALIQPAHAAIVGTWASTILEPGLKGSFSSSKISFNGTQFTWVESYRPDGHPTSKPFLQYELTGTFVTSSSKLFPLVLDLDLSIASATLTVYGSVPSSLGLSSSCSQLNVPNDLLTKDCGMLVLIKKTKKLFQIALPLGNDLLLLGRPVRMPITVGLRPDILTIYPLRKQPLK